MQSQFDFVYTEDPELVWSWNGPIVIWGSWNPRLGKTLAERSRKKRIIYCVLDAASRTDTILAMNAAGLESEYLTGLACNDKGKIVQCLVAPIRPDIIVVNNHIMADDFRSGCPDIPTLVSHPCTTRNVQYNCFDCDIEAEKKPRAVLYDLRSKRSSSEIVSALRMLHNKEVISIIEPPSSHDKYGYSKPLTPSPQVYISYAFQRIVHYRDQIVDYSHMDHDWLPALQYIDSVFCGSNFIGQHGHSFHELAAEDELFATASDASEVIRELDKACRIPCKTRRVLAKDRRRKAISQGLCPNEYAQMVYRLCS